MYLQNWLTLLEISEYVAIFKFLAILDNVQNILLNEHTIEGIMLFFVLTNSQFYL